MHFLAFFISVGLLTATPESGESIHSSYVFPAPEPPGIELLDAVHDGRAVHERATMHEGNPVHAPDSTDPDRRTLSVSTQGEVELPADRIQFNINLNAESENPQQAYELHKEREEVLVDLLEKFDISEEHIDYEPISISRAGQRPQHEQEPQYRTSQRVRLIIRDFANYEQIQVHLIEAGYDHFSGSFMSSEAEEGKERAIREAIQKAKDKAQVLADEAGLQLGQIKTINYHEAPEHPQYARAHMAMDSESGLMEFDQTVTISASVSINYEITGGGK